MASWRRIPPAFVTRWRVETLDGSGSGFALPRGAPIRAPGFRCFRSWEDDCPYPFLNLFTLKVNNFFG